MPINTEQCKRAIVAHCIKNAPKIAAQFVPLLKDDDMEKTYVEANWSRIEKYAEFGIMVREFDCKPFDDQLRATVRSTGDVILNVTVQGE